MVSTKYLTKFKNRYSVYILTVSDMFADGYNKEGRLYQASSRDYPLLVQIAKDFNIFNNSVSIHDNLVTLLNPDKIPYNYFNTNIIELDGDLTEIRSIEKLNTYEALRSFVINNNLEHLKDKI